MDKIYEKTQELYEKHNFTAYQIFDVDEKCDPTVLLDSSKVISQARTHWVFCYFNLMNAIKLYTIRLILCRCMVAKVVNEEAMCPLSVPPVNSIQVFLLPPGKRF